MPSMADQSSLFRAIRSGFTGLCPRCGEGKLFRAYLKVKDACEACALDYTRYRADDGPAYFTILIVGHLVVAPLLFLPFVWRWPVEYVLPIMLIPIAVITLTLLPRIKGAFMGVMWSNSIGADDHGPGAELTAGERRRR